MTARRPVLAVVLGSIAATALALASAAGAREQAANLLANGGFEEPVVAVGGYLTFSTGQSFPGWQVVGAAGNVAPISGTFAQNGIAFVARRGKQWIDMTGLSNTPTGVAQTVTTTPGRRYTLTFSVGNVVDRGGPFGTRSTILAFANGKQIGRATNAGGSRTRQGWRTFSASFRATGASTTIELRNGDPSSDTQCGLDDVSLVAR